METLRWLFSYAASYKYNQNVILAYIWGNICLQNMVRILNLQATLDMHRHTEAKQTYPYWIWFTPFTVTQVSHIYPGMNLIGKKYITVWFIRLTHVLRKNWESAHIWHHFLAIHQFRLNSPCQHYHHQPSVEGKIRLQIHVSTYT